MKSSHPNIESRLMQLDCGICALRNWREGDEFRLSEIANSENVSRYMTDRFPFPYTVDDARSWIGQNAAPGATNFAIVANAEIVGGMGLEIGRYENRCSAEIGYWLGEPYWKRGYASAALGALTEYAFSTYGLRRIWARVFSPNVASANILEKCGYVREAVMRNAVVKRGTLYDVFLYATVR
jgi:RimJ/RimL family protein N-acetyltransferase